MTKTGAVQCEHMGAGPSFREFQNRVAPSLSRCLRQATEGPLYR